jgi:SAM-dependent methyltransferase
MTDAAMTATPSSARAPIVPILFGVAVFTSAALVFVVQPMVAKLLLPSLGGSASVWNTSMVFFQAALLAGYAYAHALQRLGSLKVQVGVHLLALLFAAVFLPLRISGALGEPDTASPIPWLLGTLALSIGAPFAVLSATAPLLQAWYARVRAGEPDAENPYVLYAASNLGSFVALLSYPIAIEPLLRLKTQTASWTGGYVIFLLMILGLAALAWRARSGAEPKALERTAAIPWREKLIWVLLAAAPSSLLLGVTNHIAADVASAPFLWVVPLALYLLTFVVAFQRKPFLPWPITLLIHGAFAAAAASLLPFNTSPYWFLLILNLGVFFFTAMVCHQALARRRPPPDRLTEFYLLLSLGGVIGGAFNALVAPVIFDVVREYPLVLILAVLARQWGDDKPDRSDWICFIAAAALALVPMVIFKALEAEPSLTTKLSWQQAEILSRGLLFVPVICAFLIRDRAPMFMAALAMISVSAHAVQGRYDWIDGDRSFFGVLRIAEFNEPRLGGRVNMLLHGTTLHGAQALDPRHRCIPMLYYAPTTPIGNATLQTQFVKPEGATIGVVGLGTGALAAYSREQDRFHYFEIDPLVLRFARDPQRFSYIDECARGPVQVTLGDARVSLEKEPANTYDLLVIDAFSSDSVPTHLLTAEALRGYLRVLKPDGVVLLHLSNRNLEITTPAVSTARLIKAPALYSIYSEDPKSPRLAEASAEAVLIGKTSAALETYSANPLWRSPPQSATRPWTDDYVNLLGALYRDWRMSMN